MKPAIGSMTVYFKDAKGNIVLRMLQQQLTRGVYKSQFTLSYPLNPGEWSIYVEAFGATYNQSFIVQLWWRRIFDLNLTLPENVLDSEWGLVGELFGEHPSSIFAEANATVTLQIRRANQTMLPGELSQEIRLMRQQVSFEFPLANIWAKWGDVTGMDLVVTARIFDWFFRVTRVETSYAKMIRDAYVLKLIGKRHRAFKPLVPFTVHFALQRSDGRQYTMDTNRLVYVQRTHVSQGAQVHVEEAILLPDDSLVQYTVTPEDGDERIIIRAWFCLTPSNVAEVVLFRHYSESGRYIAITAPSADVRVGKYVIMTVRANFYSSRAEYVILAGGTFISSGTVNLATQQKTFTFAVSRVMAPQFRVIIYCIVDDEIVTDAITLYARDTELDSMDIRQNYAKNLRMRSLEIIATAEPGSFIAFNAMDWTIFSHHAHPFLDLERVTAEMFTYDQPFEAPYQHIWFMEHGNWEQSVFFHAPTAALDMNGTFWLNGLALLSDANLTLPEDHHTCNATLGFARCLNGACYDLARQCDGTVDCTDGIDEVHCAPTPDELPIRRPSTLDRVVPDSQFFDMVDWAWKDSYTRADGSVEVYFPLPETTVPYVISAYAMHPERGLQIARQFIQHDTTRLFFINSDAPAVAKRGEMMGIRIAVHNYWSERIEAVIVLHGSDDYRFINVDDHGVSSSYAPLTTAGDMLVLVEIFPLWPKYVFLPIVPIIEEGEIVVRVTGYGPYDSDEENVHITIQYDGAPNDDFLPYLIDLTNEPSIDLPLFETGVPENPWNPEARELSYVPGSNKAVAYVYGDVVSPGIFEDHITAWSTLLIPHDVAEGYMYEIGVNVIVLKYLRVLQALDTDTLTRTLGFLNTALMRSYAYLQEDGSYKQFRRTEKSCLWLTALSLSTLHGIVSSEWTDDVYVPIEMLTTTARWIVAQQSTDGAFIETADQYYNRNFLPVTVDSSGVEHEWHIPVTAFTTIALAMSNRITGQDRANMLAAVDKACNYMAGKLASITDPFQMAIVAYALQVSNHEARSVAYELLKAMKREGEYVYWAGEEIPPNTIIWIDGIAYMQTRADIPNVQNAAMATSFALMLYLINNELEAAKPIMKWLHTQKYNFIKWSSTIDTLLALQALMEFSYRQTNRAFYNIRVNWEAACDPTWKPEAFVNYTNFHELRQYPLNNAWGPLKVTAQGTGYAYVQMTIYWNVEKPGLVTGPDEEYFEFEIASNRESGFNASVIDVTACARWLKTDRAPMAGMTFIMITIPTGYTIPREVIEYMYETMANVSGLRRVRFYDQTLIVFFDYLASTWTCFDYTIYRYNAVANGSIPLAVSIFEYSETGIQKNTLVTAYTLSHLHICQVCGSYQCPYCSFYNTAPSHHSITSTLTTLASSFCICYIFVLLFSSASRCD